ncbi:unnamed protein product [Vitrella brassicaformis CCMP3155]|uniref:Uncharacterized protein n=2 Tax=Vitrella brassicaformis TaxID=1169539 RepID=A0A0G4FLX9_VITBC|nr:unnamed protein product [Vitrella brassicaformis CCMP3155]|eukprot:CEM15018.1 unnamed protein product [Vitrella brassicaformis CCMP3155]
MSDDPWLTREDPRIRWVTNPSFERRLPPPTEVNPNIAPDGRSQHERNKPADTSNPCGAFAASAACGLAKKLAAEGKPVCRMDDLSHGEVMTRPFERIERAKAGLVGR